jgi:hypothetical protein
MVGYADSLVNSGDPYPEDPKLRKVWFPDPDIDKNEGLDFNLVFSLASDGKHYLVADRDKPERPMGTSNILVPSTTNWHEYGTVGMTWEQIRYVNSDNQGYYDQITRSGLAGLRPPWVFKNEEDDLKPMQAYRDLEPWKYMDSPTPEKETLAWDDLGWDDD